MRFPFGRNWRSFLRVVDDERVERAESSLRTLLDEPDLTEKRLLDAGCGSGLFSLAARRLGARVHAFDYDSHAVSAARALREAYRPGDDEWVIERASVLDPEYLRSIGRFDVVYSWGVLHHTGDLETAMERIAWNVAPGGRLFIALYNDQGWISRYWSAIKRLYNRGRGWKIVIVALHAPYLLAGRFLARFLTGRLRLERGMSLWHDMLDWLGGYPFEVAAPARVVEFYSARGFHLQRLHPGRRHGCNQFVFTRRF